MTAKFLDCPTCDGVGTVPERVLWRNAQGDPVRNIMGDPITEIRPSKCNGCNGKKQLSRAGYVNAVLRYGKKR